MRTNIIKENGVYFVTSLFRHNPVQGRTKVRKMEDDNHHPRQCSLVYSTPHHNEKTVKIKCDIWSPLGPELPQSNWKTHGKDALSMVSEDLENNHKIIGHSTV